MPCDGSACALMAATAVTVCPLLASSPVSTYPIRGYIDIIYLAKEAAYRLNKLSIGKDGCSNEVKFSGVDKYMIDPSLLHVFGSPDFVLHARLQSGVAGAPTWEPRSRLGIYVGHSPSHAGSVALILNPTTGHVSPQYHIVFEDKFSTVPLMNERHIPRN